MDLFMETSSGWKGIATLFPALQTVAAAVRGDERWAEGRATTVIGSGPLAIAAAFWAQSNNAAISMAAPSDNAAMSAAKKCEVRHLPWHAVHSTHADVVILAGSDVTCGTQRAELNPSLIREGMTVIDLTRYPGESSFAEEARLRGAHYIDPSSIFGQQLQLQFKKLTGREIPISAFERALSE
jgi:3-dehydroquinate dehydratase/shikimate dehydrogenase